MVKFSIYRADITKLKVEAIVNAANESGLGCSIPGHCIDNAIHYAAGSELLEECKTLGGVPTGVAKITKAYNLPSKYIIHVTGPRKTKEGKLDWSKLAESYVSCLKLAKQYKIREIAFCCVSTGLFGFPKRESAELAIQTILEWISKEEHNLDSIIFDVFTYEDHSIYQELLDNHKIEYDSLSIV